MPTPSPAHLKNGLSRRRSRADSGILLDSHLHNGPWLTSKMPINPRGEESGRAEGRERRASTTRLSLDQSKVTRQLLPRSASALPRRTPTSSSSASLLVPKTNMPNAQVKKIPRSATGVQSRNLPPLAGYGDNIPLRSRKTACLKDEDKENNLTQLTAAKRQPRPKRSFTRKQSSPLIPRECRASQCPDRIFLVPKVNELICTPDVKEHRSTSTHSVTPQQGKGELQTCAKGTVISSLPTQILSHTPKLALSRRTAAARLLPTASDYRPRPPSSAATSCRATPSLAAQVLKYALQASSVATAALSPSPSLCTLPTQIIKHSPAAPTSAPDVAQSTVPTSTSATGPASESPCLSRARTKSLWTMSDEIALVRTGGLVAGAGALEPGSDVRVVPLCQRLRNGLGVSSIITSMSEEALAPRTPKTKAACTPARSASTPYHLLASSARRTPDARASLLPPELSISRALAHVEEASPFEASATDDAHAVLQAIQFSGSVRATNRLSWTVVNLKRLTNCRRLAADTHLLTPSLRPTPGGYGVSVYPSTRCGSSGKPSLLTRAQTFIKFKLPGHRLLTSRKLVGRGDSRF